MAPGRQAHHQHVRTLCTTCHLLGCNAYRRASCMCMCASGNLPLQCAESFRTRQCQVPPRTPAIAQLGPALALELAPALAVALAQVPTLVHALAVVELRHQPAATVPQPATAFGS